jgi:Tfp pilus assembly protein PilX
MFKAINIENNPLSRTLLSRRGIGGREKEQKVMDKKSNLILGNESGAALVVALLMIVVLSIIGLASSSSSTFEIRLAGNKRGAADAFYSADSGLLSVMGDTANFNCAEDQTPSALPAELATEGIDKKKTNPTFTLPAGYSFNDQPQVTIYQTSQTSVPRGLGASALNFSYQHYIIDSTGRDQMEIGSVRSNCEIRQKIVRLGPVGQ